MARPHRLSLLAAAAAGALVGVATSFALTDPVAPAVDGGDGGAPAAVEATATVPPSAPTPSVPPDEPDTGDAEDHGTAADGAMAAGGGSDQVLLVWTSGGLPAGIGEQLAGADDVEVVTTVRGDQADLVSSTDADGRPVDQLIDGWRIPLDVLAVDPDTFAPFLPQPAAGVVGALEPGQALLTRSSAALRRLDPGSTIELTTGTLTVAGIVDDLSGAGAEVLVHAADSARLGIDTDRYALIRHDGDRETLQRAVAEQFLSGRTIRFRTPAETMWLRHGDAVAPQVLVKTSYGEFAYREGAGRRIEVEPGWVERSIVTETVPVLGQVTCHRAVVPALRAAMDELVAANLEHLVDASAFAGCYAPRRIAAGQPMSRHAWGIAVDLNVDGNPRGSFDTQDARLVELMRRHGFSWGGTWLVPDPAHYEAIPAEP